MKLKSWSLMESLENAKSVLLAGAGGGFDVYSALPLYFALQQEGKEVNLANFSFASLPLGDAALVSPACVRVTADTPHSETYFPEFHLSCWFRDRHGTEVPVYCFARTGVAPLRAAYLRLRELLALDAVVLVDGGTDSLMRGDEYGLGTPVEDATSLAAVHGSDIPEQYHVCIGFGVDAFHEVCHAQFLEAVAALTRHGAFLGIATVLEGMPEAHEFLAAVDYANARTPGRESIVANSIASAIQGHFGDYHRTDRTRSSRLWINPLMAFYWAFNLSAVAERNLYLKGLGDTETMADVVQRISDFRAQCVGHIWEDIPVYAPVFALARSLGARDCSRHGGFAGGGTLSCDLQFSARYGHEGLSPSSALRPHTHHRGRVRLRPGIRSAAAHPAVCHPAGRELRPQPDTRPTGHL